MKPDESAGAEDLAAPKLPNLQQVRVFLIEDEPDLLDLLEKILSRAGATVQTASSGEQALASFEEFKADILICDIGLPGMDGHALIKKIRALDNLVLKNIPALALTARSGNVDHMDSILAGFNDHLAKPADPIALARRVARLVGQS